MSNNSMGLRFSCRSMHQNLIRNKQRKRAELCETQPFSKCRMN